MKIFHTTLKNKGFLIIAVSTIITIIIACFLMGYRQIINRSKRVNSFFYSEKAKCQLENLKIFTYDELFRIDRKINNGECNDGAEFVGKTNGNKIWFLNSGNCISDNGYYISRLFYSNSKIRKVCFYKKKNSSGTNLKTLIQRELYRSSKSDQRIYVELTKEFFIENTKKKIVTKALVTLEYKIKNRNVTNPDKEILKEFVASLEDI
ncbi:hypothetical protein [Fusobacterium sp.]|uniref:hypothetical protein n=1 Tax=Fusobacterium sp. TaxID=68766 RepID=UPI00396C5DF2